MSDGFDVKYQGVDDTTLTLRQQTDRVAKAIEDLDMKIQAVKQDFIGQTADQYEAKVKQWRMNVEDMRRLLGQAETTLQTIRNNYAYTDNRKAMDWSAIQ
ncbi:WXG100 family type VII secretion target [Thermobifida halotolerans]|uniref:WXG100 family type VII secretion target n=1 Tax=Thermobifida halotolerans TaxID=483545 RepID=A0A399G3E3_9ACTN|nr:WXG100 family type VII secretion target [Thermobifida halotolerans]UOE19450.1 WXG100 family type VII secretion target [Thermobifida halotolerans]